VTTGPASGPSAAAGATVRVDNPILPGFHPDPSIVCVDGTYYIATSTFEWWPGVRIHRSTDLVHWEHAAYALDRRTQLDMRGNPDSGGVWAPCLSWADGRFWLIYSDVKGLHGPFKDVTNYLVTAERIEGPWSDPIRLNTSGFDPSLFHDADGRKWLLNQVWDSRPGRNPFHGIALQEYSVREQRLIGEPALIFRGTALGVTEGPHLYRKDGYYYLVTAEGGTGWEHAVTVARARHLHGPYEVSPHHPLLTASHAPEARLQKAGHASFVRSPDGNWYLAHLCARPVGSHRRCILGRETALQRLVWPEGEWPRLATGGQTPADAIEIPLAPGTSAAPSPGYRVRFRDDFDAPRLGPEWNTLREPPAPEWLSLTERPGHLRLRGRYSLHAAFDQSLAGVRATHHRCRAAAAIDFSPRSWQQQAGLVFYYNTRHFHYLHVTADDRGRRVLNILCADNGRFWHPMEHPVPVAAHGPLILRADLLGTDLQFIMVDPAGGAETPIGPVLDATLVSDDRVIETGYWGFTGAYFALCAQDTGNTGIPADFDWFACDAIP